MLSIALAEFELQGKAALTFALNSRRHVGDIVWLIRESGDVVEHQPAYPMDVSAEGAKFKYVDRHTAAIAIAITMGSSVMASPLMRSTTTTDGRSHWPN